MKVLVLGGVGFCGWPTALHLSARGWDVTIVDNLSRRNIDNELEVQSLTPIRTMGERIAAWKEVSGKTIGFVTHSIPEAVYLATKIVVMSPRPGRITDVIDSPLPKDRPLEIRDSRDFIEIAHRVREGLRAGHGDEV